MRIARISGISIEIHASWLIIFVLLVWMLASESFGVGATGVGISAPSLFLAILTSLLFFGSVLLHELAHAWTAQARGVPVRRITLFIFGGLAQMGRELRSPRGEFVVALAGPATSLLLAVLWGGVFMAGRLLHAPTVAFIGAWLAVQNLFLAVFNMIPGFPLDGGRVFRAFLWRVSGDYLFASRVATLGGQGIGWLFVAGGLAATLRLPSLGAAGLWICFVGWLLAGAAGATFRQAVAMERLRGLTVEAIRRPIETVSPDTPLRRIVDEHSQAKQQLTFGVVDGGRFLGLLGMPDILRRPEGQWPALTAAQVMRPAESTAMVSPLDRLDVALERMGEHEVGALPVLSEGRLLGLVVMPDIVRTSRGQ